MQCHLALPCLTPELSAGSLSIPGELHPSMQVTLPGCVSQRTVPAPAALRIHPMVPPELCRCAQVSSSCCSWCTCNSLCCSSGASCSPVLPLPLSISTGIKLVRLGCIQVLQVWIPQTHLVLPALPWTGIHGTPTCAPDLPGICLGVKFSFLGLFPLFWLQPGEISLAQEQFQPGRRQERGKLGCGVGLPALCWL